MNYIELINHFWKLDRERPFAASDTRLFFYLVHTCNSLGWKNPFGHADRHLATQVSVCVNTIRKAKNRLIEAGLIEVESPEKPSNSLKGQSRYTILTVSKNDTVKQLTVSKNDTVCDTVCDTVYCTVSDTNNKPNQNETKENIKRRFEIFQNDLANKYQKVSRLEHQMTLSEFKALIEEFSLTPGEFNNLLERMENYKPLLKNCSSVYLTLRLWQQKTLKQNTIFAANNFKKPPEPNHKQFIPNEGPTL